jgi:hypothetical protein
VPTVISTEAKEQSRSCADRSSQRAVPTSTAIEKSQAALEYLLPARFQIIESRISVGRRTFGILHPKAADDLISEEDYNRDGRLPYWADIWASAIALAELLSQEHGGGRRLLELGSGVGLAACAAVAAGFSVTATDYYAEACDFTLLNARRNGLPAPAVRVVEKPNCDLVASCFARALASDGLGILTDPQRTLATDFPAAAERAGLITRKRCGMPVDQLGRRQVIDVYELWPAKGEPPRLLHPSRE